jgi:hypothetical protein
MKYSKLFLLFCFISFSLYSQPKISWQKTFGGSEDDYPYYTHSKIITSDGGIFIAGTTSSSDGNVRGFHGVYDIWALRLDSRGGIIWQKALGGSEDEYAVSFIETADKGFLLVGSTISTDGEVSGNHGDYDVWVVKMSSTGAVQWSKCLGGTGSDYGYSAALSADGGYLIGGKTWSSDGNVTNYKGSGDGWLVKLSSSGALLWQKTFGGSSEDNIWDIKPIKDGYLISGTSKSANGDLPKNYGLFDLWLMKINLNGVVQWSKNFGGNDNEYAYSSYLKTDGNFLVVGETNSKNGDVKHKHEKSDIWVLNVDSKGNLLWQKTYGGNGEEWATSIEPMLDGSVLICGSTNSNDNDFTGNHGSWDGLVFKIDTMGNLLWQKQLGGTGFDDAYIAQQSATGRILIGGDTESNDGDVSGNHGKYDFWIVELEQEVSATSSARDFASFLISPNPVQHELFLEFPGWDERVNVNYEICSVEGICFVKGILNTGRKMSISLNQLPAGNYFIRIVHNRKVSYKSFAKM